MIDTTNVKTDYLKQDGAFTIGATNKSSLDAETISLLEDSDRHSFLEDGTLVFSDNDGTTQVVPQSYQNASVDLSKIDAAAIKSAADIMFLAQNTGVNSSDMNASYEALGLDPNDSQASVKRNAILKTAGYKPGEQNEFYGANKPEDIGAEILFDRWSQAPSDEELEAAGIDPSSVTVINSNSANAAYLAEEMAKRNLSSSDTNARIDNANRLKVNEGYKESEKYLDKSDYWKDKISKAGSYADATLDMLEWDLVKNKQEGTGVGTTGRTVDQPTATVTGTNFTGQGQGNITGGATGSITAPTYSSTPNIGVVTPTYGAGQTGTSETTIPSYEDGLKKQATQFQDRATCQATFYQPQTQAEKETAGTAPAFENKLYRNRFGMSMYIQHINGVPSQPIPPGYSEVQQFTTQGQNQGGMIQGFMGGGVISPINDDGKNKFRIFYPNGTFSQVNYSTEAQAQAKIAADNEAAGYNASGNSAVGNSVYADATVNPALNYKPGGQVVTQADGTFALQYPDGTFSQGYTSSEEAQQADNLGKASIGIQNFDQYSQAQGFNPDLAGYDQTSVQNMYNTYVTDTYASQQAAANALPPEATVNQDFITGQQNVTEEDLAQQQRNLAAQAYVAPGGAVAASPTSYIDPNVYGSVVESTAGQAQATAPMVESDQVAQISAATTADTPTKIGASQVTPNYAFSDVQNATAGMTAAQMTGGPTQTIDAAQQTGTSLSGLTSATSDSINVVAPTARTLQTGPNGELITGTGVDQAQVGQAFGTGEVQAASIQGELAGLMQQFEGGETPAWAAGSMRNATAMLAARGLGASSMAGQAVIQAAMEAALPIAQIDTANKQQVALFKAEQRAKFLQMDFDQAFQAKVMNAAKVSEIANMNFTAEQQIALENSRAANTMQLQNLSNSQALVMAEAAALSQMDTQNLNNRQQANVQNAQNFLQVDMTNLANEQQTALFKQQSLVNSLLTDQAAANAALQFNASSENQTNQFFANLSSSIGQFNAAQLNAMKQFNAGEVNSLLEFNANIQNQREMFNAQNYLVVAQANAQWRQNIATLNTAAANESNMDYAKTVNALTVSALDQIWQRERDLMDYSFTGGENQADGALSLLLGDMQLDAVREQINAEEESAMGALLTKIFFKV